MEKKFFLSPFIRFMESRGCLRGSRKRSASPTGATRTAPLLLERHALGAGRTSLNPGSAFEPGQRPRATGSSQTRHSAAAAGRGGGDEAVAALPHRGADSENVDREKLGELSNEERMLISSAKPKVVGCDGRSNEGGQQGDPVIPMAFCIALHPDIVWADEQLALNGGGIRTQMDDMYAYGLPEHVLPIVVELEQRIKDRCGLVLKLLCCHMHMIIK